MLPEILVGKPENLQEVLARRLEDVARLAIVARGRFALALPGGSVATTFFPRLATAQVDWSRTHCFWGDERALPPTDPESNYGVARALLLDRAGVPAGGVHRMKADEDDLEGAAHAYENELVSALGRPPRLDVVILGMGPDGHVCSLFPGHSLLQERTRWVSAVVDSPKPPSRRLTLTLPSLEAAAFVVVAAFGETKAAALREAIEDSGSALPVALAVRGAARALFLLDQGAASRLSPAASS
jgi:6-phosphogluconolactonase